MAVNNGGDEKVNSRSPYYIEANRTYVPVVVPVDNCVGNPVVTITASNPIPFTTETITLTANTTVTSGAIVSYEWGGFGSGSTQSITATYTSALIQSEVFTVKVTLDNGCYASATIVIDWQDVPQIPVDLDVNCGDIISEASFIGEKKYNLLVGTRTGAININFITPQYTNESPVTFKMEWNGTSVSDVFGLIPPTDITSKGDGYSLTLNKTTEQPEEVTLTAFAGLENDNYSFQLECPTQLFATKFHTLEGTCEIGYTTFTYTDSKGVTQTVQLLKGETIVISGIVGSVVVAECTGIVTEGGDSFDTPPEQEVDEFTELIIVLDDTGSMIKTQKPLIDMINGNLKQTLLEYYNNDSALYDKRVKFHKSSELWVKLYGTPVDASKAERFLRLATAGKEDPDATKTIYMFFQNEASAATQTAYQLNNNTGYDTATAIYRSDIAGLRAFLSATPYGEFFMKLFVVDYSEPANKFLEDIFSGEEGFSGEKGLSDRSECSAEGRLKEQVKYADNSQYYYDFVIEALRGYGFNL